MPQVQLCTRHRVSRDGCGRDKCGKQPLHWSDPHFKSKRDDVSKTRHKQELISSIYAYVPPLWTPRITRARVARVGARLLLAAGLGICASNLDQRPHRSIFVAQWSFLQNGVGQCWPHLAQHGTAWYSISASHGRSSPMGASAHGGPDMCLHNEQCVWCYVTPLS